MQGRRRPQPQSGPHAGMKMDYLGWLLSPGGESALLCSRQARGCPEGLGGGMDYSAQWEAQVCGAAHMGPGEKESCCGHCSMQGCPCPWAAPLAAQASSEQRRKRTRPLQDAHPSDACLLCMKRCKTRLWKKVPHSPHTGPGDVLTDCRKLSPGPCPAAASPFAAVPTGASTQFWPKPPSAVGLLWSCGLNSLQLSSPLENSLHHPTCTAHPVPVFSIPMVQNRGQPRSFSPSFYVFFNIFMKKTHDE